MMQDKAAGEPSTGVVPCAVCETHWLLRRRPQEHTQSPGCTVETSIRVGGHRPAQGPSPGARSLDSQGPPSASCTSPGDVLLCILLVTESSEQVTYLTHVNTEALPL